MNAARKAPKKEGIDYLRLVKWSAMVAAIAWAVIHRLGAEAAAIPEFVYVNF